MHKTNDSCIISFLPYYQIYEPYPEPYISLLPVSFINRFGCFVYPFLTLYLGARGYSAAQIVFVLVAMGAGNVLGPIVSGYLADAIGRRNTIVISLVSSALLMVGILMVIDYYPLLLVVSATYGFASFLYGPASSALLTDLVPSEQRVTAFALVRFALNGGFAAGPALGGLLYAYSPSLIFIGDALTTLLFAGLAIMWLPHGLRTVEGRVTSPKVFYNSWKLALIDMATHRLFKQYIFSLLFMAIGFIQVFDVLVIAATDAGLSPARYGMIMSLNGLLILLIEMPICHILKRLPPRLVLAAGFAVMALGLASFGLVDSFVGFLVAMTVFTLGEIIALPVGMAYSSTLAPEVFRGRYLGVRGLAWGFGGMIASGGIWMYAQIGPVWWILAGGLVAMAAVVILFPLTSIRVRGDKATA